MSGYAYLMDQSNCLSSNEMALASLVFGIAVGFIINGALKKLSGGEE